MTPRTALVTGAGTGIGRAAARSLLTGGWQVVLAGRRREPLEAVAREHGLGDTVLVVTTDVTQPAEVDALFDAVVQRFGRLDLLFNNAGISGTSQPIADISFTAWQQVVATNLTGMFLCLQAAFRLMSAQAPRGGRIINNGSLAAHAPRPDTLPYTATKHAVTGMTKAAALEGRRHDIAVGQIDIGNAATDMVAAMSRGVPQANGELRPEPMMDVALVGDAILHMANLPPQANVLFQTLMATAMPLVGRG
ncbi:MAG: SDR family oxidoreductase [Pigmentiphaga sp.]|nr:SDR family oxidoreductase [Pigmentiphaga sp.]